MEIIKKHLTNGQYMTQEYVKDSIFLHHTAGLNAEGAWQWWNQTPERVGTPYIIDRDGKIIECFDPKMWAYHLGVNNDDNYHEMHSINVELVSGGQLYPENGQFKFYPLYPNTQFFTIIPKDEVIELGEPWRGFKFYHKYTDLQIEALRELLIYLHGEFPTIKFQSDLTDFYELNPVVIAKHQAGLWSHSTVRADKTDIIPYVPLLDMLNEVKILFDVPTKAPETAKSSNKKSKA
jgi:N-acetyl-anhydromuramyl-L-alanine amidase AmpD